MIRSVTAAFVLIAATVGTAASDEPGLRRYELPNRDTLELTLPAGWVDQLVEP